MARKLFTEDFLTREIPDEIMERITNLAGITDQKIYDAIGDSEDVKKYESSFSVPPVIVGRCTSVLLADLRVRNPPGTEKLKKSFENRKKKNN